MRDDLMCLCLCAPRQDDRRARVSGLAEAVGMPLEFMVGPDAARLEEEKLWITHLADDRRRRGYPPLTRGEIACAEGHVRALKRFLDSDKRFLLLMEDNVHFEQPMMDFLSVAPLDKAQFDIIRLEQRKPSRFNAPVWREGPFSLVFSPHIGAGVCAILYTRRGAQKAVSYMRRNTHGFDVALGLFWRGGLKIMTVRPPVARRAQIPSAVDAVDKRFGQSRRAPARASLAQSARRSVDRFERQICKYVYSAAFTIAALMRR